MKKSILFHCDRCPHTTNNGVEMATIRIPIYTVRMMQQKRPKSTMTICRNCQDKLADFLKNS